MHGNQQVPPAILRMQPGVSNGTAARPTLPSSTHPSLRQPLPVCRVKDGRCGWRRSREQILKKETSSFPTDLWTEHAGFQIGLKPPRSNCVPAPSNQFQTTTCVCLPSSFPCRRPHTVQRQRSGGHRPVLRIPPNGCTSSVYCNGACALLRFGNMSDCGTNATIRLQDGSA